MTNTKIEMTRQEFVEAVMRAKAKAFNDKYDPVIRGFDVEIYVEPAEDKDMNNIPDEIEHDDDLVDEVVEESLNEADEEQINNSSIKNEASDEVYLIDYFIDSLGAKMNYRDYHEDTVGFTYGRKNYDNYNVALYLLDKLGLTRTGGAWYSRDEDYYVYQSKSGNTYWIQFQRALNNKYSKQKLDALVKEYHGTNESLTEDTQTVEPKAGDSISWDERAIYGRILNNPKASLDAGETVAIQEYNSDRQINVSAKRFYSALNKGKIKIYRNESLTEDTVRTEALTEAVDFNTIFNSSGFEQNVINKMSFLSNKIDGKVRRFIYEYIENKFDDLVFEIKDLEADGLSKKEIISVLADDVYEENPKLKYYVNDLAEFIYRTVKYIISNRQDESLTEAKNDDWCYIVEYEILQDEEGPEAVRDLKQNIRDHGLKIKQIGAWINGWKSWAVIGSKEKIESLINDFGDEDIDELVDLGYLGPVSDILGESLTEDTVKQDGKWVNKGAEGTHGKFKTKKEADAQRKAMFANGYKESLDENNSKLNDYFDINEDADAGVERVRAILSENGDHYDVYEKDGKIAVEIDWGDWKHDHIYLDNLLSDHGFVKVDEEETEEDGSDTYSSIHYFEDPDDYQVDETLELHTSLDDSEFEEPLEESDTRSSQDIAWDEFLKEKGYDSQEAYDEYLDSLDDDEFDKYTFGLRDEFKDYYMDWLDKEFKYDLDSKYPDEEDVPSFWEWIEQQGMNPDDVEDNPDLEDYYQQQYDITFNLKSPEDYRY